MTILLTIIHILVCLLLVLAVLLQSGKGGGLASALGGGLSSSSVLGGRSAATFLSKATTYLAIFFMVSCLVQAVLARTSDEVPTTATERMLKEQGAPPIAPAPFMQTEASDAGEASPQALPGGTDESTEPASPGAGDADAATGGDAAEPAPTTQPAEATAE